MVGVALAAAMAAWGEVAVVRCLDAAPERCEDIAQRVRTALGAGSRPTPEEARLQAALDRCRGERQCVADVLGPVRAWATVDVAQVGDRVAVQLEAARGGPARAVRAAFLLSALTYPAGVELEVARFSAQVLGAFPEEPPVARVIPADVPRQVELAPAVAPPSGLAKPPSRAGPIALGAVGLVGGALAAALAGVGASAATSLDAAKTTVDGKPASTLTRAQAEALAARGNGAYSAALGIGLGASALVTAAVVWWFAQ